MAQVTLRLASLDVAGEVSKLHDLLGAEEKARAARFVAGRHRRRFIVRRGRLRQWLGAVLKADPAALRFTTNAYGKPEIPGSGLHFSASHSGETLAVALSDVPVGCDIEVIDAAFDRKPVMVLFGPEEQAELAALPASEACNGFFRAWARKEAFVKALGQGLAYPLDAFAVTCGKDARLTRGEAGWAIAAADHLGLAGAVVARGETVALETISAF